MKLVWTKGNSILSIFIRAVTGEDCSHFAIVFNSPGGGLMFESNLLGTHPKFYRTALKHLTIMHEIEVPMSIEEEDAIWDQTVDEYDGKPYNLFGGMYLLWRKWLNRIFGFKIPEKNRFAPARKFYCDQLYAIMSGRAGLPSVDVIGGMFTPYELFVKLGAK